MPLNTKRPFRVTCGLGTALGVLAGSLSMTACEDEALAGGREGFFLAVGGGASTVERPGALPELKDSQVALHRAGLRALADARARAAARKQEGVPEGVCSLEYRAPGADTDDALAVSKRLFVAAGAPEASVRGFVFESRARADDARVVEDLVQSCGLVSLPGGDQTEMRALWERTRLHEALKRLVTRGGGIMGKSAGAALQGTLGYFPEPDAETTTFALLRGRTLARRELEPGFFASTVPDLPRFYVETHAGDRERAARALALLAAWEERKPSNETRRAFALVVDSDTGVLIRYDAPVGAWTADVVGARAVEALFPTAASESEAGRGGAASGRGTRWPAYTSVASHLLLDGARFVVSGPRLGEVLRTSTPVRWAPPRADAVAACGANLEGLIEGRFDRDGERNGVVSFDAFDPTSSSYRSLGEVEYAYLTGDLRARQEEGCGYWMTNAFDPDVGRPENRLNAQRYALGLGRAGGDFAVGLPAGMVAFVDEVTLPDGRRSDTVTFEADDATVSSEEKAPRRARSKGRARGPERADVRASSVFLYDVAHASRLGVSSYVYAEMGARGPVQTGHWQGGVTHLLPPGGAFDIASRTVRRGPRHGL